MAGVGGSEALQPDDRPQRRREYSGPGSTLGVAALAIAVVGLAIWWLEFRGNAGSDRLADAPGIIELPAHLNPTGQPPAAEPGRAAPDFELRDPGGRLVRLSEFRGQVVLVNFWASWCGPCRAEAPALVALAETMTGNLVILGVDQQETLDAVESFIDEFSITYPVVLDHDGEVSEAYRVGRGLPVSFVVGRNGVIQSVIAGQVREDHLAALRGFARQ